MRNQVTGTIWSFKRKEEKKMAEYNYQIAASTWDAISNEVRRLKTSIDNDVELTPEDVKEVRRLVKLVTNASTEYNKALTASYKNYKAMLSQKLNEIGYDVIDAYIVKKRNEQQSIVSERLTAKVDKFTRIIHEALEQTQKLKRASFAQAIPSQMLVLFPKVNSGAITNDIADWTPISFMVKQVIDHAETKMNDLILSLPSTSNVANTFGQYFRSADRGLLVDMIAVIKQDEEWLMNKHIAAQLNSEQDVLSMIEQLAHEKSDQSLAQIRKLLTIWDTKYIYEKH